VGASAGGVEALRAVVTHLPPDLAATVFVVLHLPPVGTSVLPRILERAGQLRAVHASDGTKFERACIYIAPPDQHMRFADGHIKLDRGPRENGHRPAIDPLFRSAARTFGNRTIAVILSGTLDDGTAGAAAVHAAGGVTVAQDPDDAINPSMPLSAIENAHVDHVASADEMSELLVRLVADGVPPAPREAASRSTASAATDLVCPECGGVLRQFQENGVFRFHCRIGHNYSPEALYNAQDAKLEAALWAAIRSLEESATLSRRLAIQARDRGAVRTARRFDEREREAAERADLIRSAILSLSDLEELPSIGEAEPVASEDDARRPYALEHPPADREVEDASTAASRG